MSIFGALEQFTAERQQQSFLERQESLVAEQRQQISELKGRIADLVQRLDVAEKTISEHQQAFRDLSGSFESFRNSAGGDLAELIGRVGLGMQILARMIPTGTILRTHQTNEKVLEQFGWLICDGRSLPVDLYAPLARVLGFGYGQSQTPGMFNLPTPWEIDGGDPGDPSTWTTFQKLVSEGKAAYIVRM